MEIAISSFVVLLMIGLELPIALSFLSATFTFVLLTGARTSFITSVAYQALDSFALMAIPFFLVAGDIMNKGGLANRLIAFAGALMARIRGGLGATIPVASMFFGALTGSGTATVAAIGSIMIPRLEKYGYARRYTGALTAASGSLGYMIPPSMLGIIYGVISDTSIAAIFLATILPGIWWGISNVVINAIWCKKWQAEGVKDGNILKRSGENYWGEVGTTFWRAIPAFTMPFIILGGIYGGVFTPTEAGAVSALYALPVGLFIYREIKVRDTLKLFVASARTFGVLFIILSMVLVYTRILLLEGVPQDIALWLSNVSSNKYVVLLILNGIFLIAGMFLDAVTLTVIMTPLMMPAALSMGIDPIHLGTILFVNIGIGTFTPPMATNLFVVSRVGQVPYQNTLKPLIPFLLYAALPSLLLTTYVPWLSLWLPKVIMGHSVLRGPIGW
jgi:C4-dicarboxylate transporter DctM subunit